MAVCAHLGLLEDSLTCHQQASGWVVGGGVEGEEADRWPEPFEAWCSAGRVRSARS